MKDGCYHSRISFPFLNSSEILRCKWDWFLALPGSHLEFSYIPLFHLLSNFQTYCSHLFSCTPHCCEIMTLKNILTTVWVGLLGGEKVNECMWFDVFILDLNLSEILVIIWRLKGEILISYVQAMPRLPEKDSPKFIQSDRYLSKLKYIQTYSNSKSSLVMVMIEIGQCPLVSSSYIPSITVCIWNFP